MIPIDRVKVALSIATALLLIALFGTTSVVLQNSKSDTSVSNQWTCQEWKMHDQVSKMELYSVCERVNEEDGRVCTAEFGDENATLEITNVSDPDLYKGNLTTCVFNETGRSCDGKLGSRVEYRFTACSEYVQTQRPIKFKENSGGDSE